MRTISPAGMQTKYRREMREERRKRLEGMDRIRAQREEKTTKGEVKKAQRTIQREIRVQIDGGG
ncbi:MAG: hypothetical protein QMD78_06155 [Methanocellales archaeon]|nr:hypothetical protein [Methanocellales archaeon]